MTVRVFLLLGGIMSADGVLTSAGMNTVAGMLRALPFVSVTTYLWASWTQAYNDVMQCQSDKVTVIGYSGGGMKATWIANGCVSIGGQIQYVAPPRIDLLVAYDPSPSGASIQPLHDNVKRAMCYHNKHPWMFGIGGGQLRRVAMSALPLETIEISMQHLAVQFNGELHRRTVEEVRKLCQ